MEIRELEAFLVLSEELHFGRAAERLYVSQGRVSQLLQTLERRIGGRLLERTSRRVALTPLGERLLADLRPAYDGLVGAVDNARAAAHGIEGVLRIGFSGVLLERLTRRVEAFQDRYPSCAVELVELPYADPFGAVRRREVDGAIVLSPVREPDLESGPPFSVEPLTLAVSRRHPYAGRPAVSAEELAGCALVAIAEPAPRYWREAQSPVRTPAGLPIPSGPVVSTFQEGLSAVAADRAAMLFCTTTAYYYGRTDITFVPVKGLPESSLVVVQARSGDDARVRAFSEIVTT
ncbi:LysR family transcriptional regulator [Actinomadura barringtoniae]|uniref:LysR family transcriptional regulator n=1 Tax=Actinomadura barringtoniae TaxID=1427535 RepID=A0A939P665_9ACTN|nr:LysR family transcriptional regulator [Actinomadura barringtoniae]